MDMSPTVTGIQSDLAAAAAIGDEATAEAGRRLAAAVEPSLQLRLLDLLAEVTLALNAQLPDGHVELRLVGRDPELVLVTEEGPEGDAAVRPGDEASARITLRLPEALKSRVEAAAALDGVSTNAWIVRALGRATEGRSPRGQSGTRLSGFAES
jgi:HicB family